MVPELTVSDFAESLAFYTQKLGFEIVFSRSDGAAFAYMDLEGAQLMLEEFHQEAWNVAELHRPYGRGINLQIECSDAGLLRDGLVGSEHPLYREVEDVWRDTGDTVTGSREFLVQDPDGYLLRFSQHLGEKATHETHLERGIDV